MIAEALRDGQFQPSASSLLRLPGLSSPEALRQEGFAFAVAALIVGLVEGRATRPESYILCFIRGRARQALQLSAWHPA